MRVVYDKGWYGRRVKKSMQDQRGDDPFESLFSLCKMPDLLRHRTSEFQDPAILTCTIAILDSLLLPEGDKPLHIFKRAVSFFIPHLVRDTPKPGRL